MLTLNQIRLVLRLAAAHGVELDQSRVPEVLATVGAGFGFRTLARTLLGVVPVAGWAVRGAVAYGGTRALGEAARRCFAVAESAEADPATREHPEGVRWRGRAALFCAGLRRSGSRDARTP